MNLKIQYIPQCTPCWPQAWFRSIEYRLPLMECDLEWWYYRSESILYLELELFPVIFRSGRKLKIKLERNSGHHAANFVHSQ